MRIHPEATRAALISMLVNCCRFLDLNKTMTEAGDFEMTLNELLRVFPCFTIEDWRLCTYKMINEEYGPYFERLKLAQFVNCFRKYEQQRQPIIEIIRENERKDAETAQTELMRYIQPEYATAKEPTVRDRVDAVDWFKGENRLTYTERQEMDERQKQTQLKTPTSWNKEK